MIAILAALAAVASQPVQRSPSPADLFHPAPGCTVDLDAMLKLPPYDFDQTDKGWRSIAKPECNITAADLIGTYRRANWGKLTNNDVAISYWHEGQSRAMAGQTEQAIPLLLAGVNPAATGLSTNTSFGLANAEYALATVAFLQRDLPALKAARARLFAIPEPPEYTEFFKTVPVAARVAAKWPPNLNVVDGLIACFGKSYGEAYGCRPE